MSFDYSNATYPIRNDIALAHREAWRRIAEPGYWWSGAERIAICEETRRARECAYCAERKAALSPYSVTGSHDSAGSGLPDAAVDAVHRLITDAARLSEAWIRELASNGVSDAHYAELLGLVVALASIDGFHRALGVPLEPLPQPVPGNPSRYRPPTAAKSFGWLPTISARSSRNTDEADLYAGLPLAPNVIAAMSLAPDSVRLLKLLSAAHYLKGKEVGNPASNGGRALSRPQIELVGARVSALNECFY